MPKDYRLNKYIALCTGCSRREADKYIESGLVKLNDSKVKDLSTRVNDADKVTLKDKKLKLSPYSTYIFNKPAGYITTRKDEKGRKTIYDLLPENIRKLKPVGRLDKDSSGLIILTNDGDLINMLTHPKFHVPKKYRVVVDGKFNMTTAKNFIEGIDIGESQMAHAEVLSFLKMNDGSIELILLLHQGFNRQIRRMLEKVNCKVISLKRLSIATLNLSNLKRGESKSVNSKEIKNLNKFLQKRLKEQNISLHQDK